tara:strand:+ start:2248 stop:3942 length:1695 start_codon:yes stop_codon:yes gene_type:complete
MKEKKPSKKNKITKFIAITAIILALVLSSVALNNTLDIKEIKSGTDGESSLTRISSIYGTHGCDEGGFSIQIGPDSNDNSLLDDEEVMEIRNICHGKQGESGPMGNRGYQGYNGSNGTNGMSGEDGTNGMDGVLGESAFIQSFRGPYGSCPEAVVIEMGNNSTSQSVDSSIKICFENLTSGRVTDIQPNSGNSFSTPCEGGITMESYLIFSAVKTGKCQLFSLDGEQVNLISPDVDFVPGNHLGFIEQNGRVWFDATDSSGVELWSTDGINTWKESNLSSDISNDDSLIKVGLELVLTYDEGFLIIGESDTLITGVFTNTTSVNGALLYNTPVGISVDGQMVNGDIHSSALYHDGYYWFIATSDGNGPQLHRWNNIGLERMSNDLQGVPGQSIPPTLVGEHILFDSNGLYSFNTTSLSISELNSTIQDVGVSTGGVLHENKLWFSCGIPSSGYELCASDGESAWIHSDHVSGMASSSPSHLAIVGDFLLAIITDPNEGGQLHLVDQQGMTLLWDHDPGNLASGVHGELWVGMDSVYFIADSATYGIELYEWSSGELSNEWIIIH